MSKRPSRTKGNQPATKKQRAIGNFFATPSSVASSSRSLKRSPTTIGHSKNDVVDLASDDETKESDINASPFRVYVDLDGVLCDFDAGVRSIFKGRGPDDLNSITMWAGISRAGGFYEKLPWTSDGKQLWDAVKDIGPPDILTGVPRHRSSREEKAKWCRRELFGNGIVTNHVDMAGKKSGHDVVSGTMKEGVVNVITCWSKNKHMQSGKNCVLIDDREKLAADWERMGGIFVLHTDTETTLVKLRSLGILGDESAKKELTKEGASGKKRKLVEISDDE